MEMQSIWKTVEVWHGDIGKMEFVSFGNNRQKEQERTDTSLQNQVAQMSPALITGPSPLVLGSTPPVPDNINVEAAFSPDSNSTSSGRLNVARHRKGKHQTKRIKTLYHDKSPRSRMVSKYPRNINMSTPFLEYDKGIVFKPVSIGLQRLTK
jgi:hypothetical protein